MMTQEIFSSWTHKTEHLQRIHRRTGIPFKSMLFFDDEDRNIEAVTSLVLFFILSLFHYVFQVNHYWIPDVSFILKDPVT